MHTAVWIPEGDRAFATLLARYRGRNPVAVERLTYDRAAPRVTRRAIRASPRFELLSCELRLVRSRYTGPYGIDRRASMVFVAGPAGANTIRVYAHRASGFTPRRIDSVVAARK